MLYITWKPLIFSGCSHLENWNLRICFNFWCYPLKPTYIIFIFTFFIICYHSVPCRHGFVHYFLPVFHIKYFCFSNLRSQVLPDLCTFGLSLLSFLLFYQTAWVFYRWSSAWCSLAPSLSTYHWHCTWPLL